MIIKAYLNWQPFKNDSLDWADSNGLTHLHVVCHEGHKNVLEIVKIYLKNGSDVNACYHTDPMKQNCGSTPLHFAMKEDQFDVVALLLKNGADINAANAKGVTPFHLACQSINLLVQEKIEFFINSFHADIHARDGHGNTPLLSIFDDCPDMEFYFSITHAKQTFDVLMKNGANIFAINNDGDTVLHLIIKTLRICHNEWYFFYDSFNDSGHAELVEQILKSNNELLEKKNNQDETPLRLAVSMTSRSVVKILLNHKANTNSLRIACENGSIFYRLQIVPGFDIVQSIMNIIDLLAKREFKFSLEDHLMIIKFLVHEADVCDCSCDGCSCDLCRVIQCGTGKHVKQVFCKMREEGTSFYYERNYSLPDDLYMMKEANIYMDKELKEMLISPRSESFILNEKAKEELKILKSDIKLKNGVMLYDLMLQHPYKASRFLKDDNFDCKLIDGFVEFKDIILGFVTKTIVRNYIVKRAYEFVAHTPLSLLPALCFEIVLHHLSNLDIFNLCASALLPESNNI